MIGGNLSELRYRLDAIENSPAAANLNVVSAGKDDAQFVLPENMGPAALAAYVKTLQEFMIGHPTIVRKEDVVRPAELRPDYANMKPKQTVLGSIHDFVRRLENVLV